MQESPGPVRTLGHSPSGEPVAGAQASLPSVATSPDHLVRQSREATVSRRSVVSIGAAMVIVVYLFAIIGTAEMAPAHVIVLDDARARTFTTPACATARPADAPALVRTTIGAARAQGHVPEPACWSSGGFLGNNSSRLEQLLETLRLDRRTEKSRWRADGSWRW